MDLILHAGMHKCGSTFIQNTLFENEDALGRAGVLYPRTGLALTDRGIGFRHVKLTHDIASGRLVLCDQLHREIAASGSRTVVISHEGMALPEHDAGRFARAFERYATTVVIYGRSPADYIEALYRSSLRTGTIAAEIGTYIGKRWARLDLQPVLTSWRTAFGAGRVRFFPFAQFGRDYPLANHLLETGGVAPLGLRATQRANPRETNARTLVRLVVNQLAHEGVHVPRAVADTMEPAYLSNEGRLLDDELLTRMQPELDRYQMLLQDEGYPSVPDRTLDLPFDAAFFDPDLRRHVRDQLIAATGTRGIRPAERNILPSSGWRKSIRAFPTRLLQLLGPRRPGR